MLTFYMRKYGFSYKVNQVSGQAQVSIDITIASWIGLLSVSIKSTSDNVEMFKNYNSMGPGDQTGCSFGYKAGNG
jgi:hypothetical protein